MRLKFWLTVLWLIAGLAVYGVWLYCWDLWNPVWTTILACYCLYVGLDLGVSLGEHLGREAALRESGRTDGPHAYQPPHSRVG